MGCDHEVNQSFRQTQISIHAPTWGATLSVQPSESISLTFQSTHPRGVRRQVGKGDFPCIKFQSTHPRGVRLGHLRHLGLRDAISIHAPTWGATRYVSLDTYSQAISIHAPTWGATVKPSNGWLLGHKDNEFANENIIIINSVNIT